MPWRINGAKCFYKTRNIEYLLGTLCILTDMLDMVILMNEYTVPKSEIIENLKRDIESKENKLEHLLDEKNKATTENRLVELTNIIRITEQEIKFGKEDLENAQ